MQTSLPDLIIENIAFERQYHYLFKELNSTLHPGECLQIRGTNGSGKSTLLRMLAGFIEAEIGAILWHGKSIAKQRYHYSQQVFYLGHQNALKPNLTVLENLKLNDALLEKPQDDKWANILDAMHLSPLHDKKIKELSAGQQRRVSLARLFLKHYPLWILDEPTTALDSQGQTTLMQLLQQHLTSGGMAVIATHHDLPISSLKTITLGEHHE